VTSTTSRRAPLIIFLIVGGALAVLLVVYTILHHPPRLPADADHRTSRQPADCLECHGPGKKSPRGPNHPPAQNQCFNCHDA
jgi:hypothetical protein